MQNPFAVHHSPHVCNKKIKHTDLCYFHLQLISLDWSRSRSRSFWSRSHNRFSVSVSVSISVSHSLVSVLALVSLCSGLINKPESMTPRCRKQCVGIQVFLFLCMLLLTAGNKERRLTSFPDHFLPNCFRFPVLYTV